MSNSRRYPGEKHRADKAKFRRDEAKERQAAYDKLSAAEKLSALDIKLGKGIGAVRQRERLNKLLNKTSEKPMPVIDESVLQEIEEMNKPSKKKTRSKTPKKQPTASE